MARGKPLKGAALHNKVIKQCRADLSESFEADFSDWEAECTSNDGVTLQVTLTNPRTQLIIYAYDIYYDDDGDILQSIWSF